MRSPTAPTPPDARQLSDVHGFAATQVAQLADEADVTVQAVFNHFPTTQDLVVQGRCSWLWSADAWIEVATLLAVRTPSPQRERDRCGTACPPCCPRA